MTIMDRILHARRAAMDAGLVPDRLELGADDACALGALGFPVCGHATVLGMRIALRVQPGITVMALPGR